MAYQLTVFVNEQSPITPGLLVAAIKKWYVNEPSVQVKITPEERKIKYKTEPDIRVQYPMEVDEEWARISEEAEFWEIRIWFLSEPSDPEYHEAFLKDAVDQSCYSQIAASKGWIEVAADKDYKLEYFNDCLYITHAIESFPGLVIYNHIMEEFTPTASVS